MEPLHRYLHYHQSLKDLILEQRNLALHLGLNPALLHHRPKLTSVKEMFNPRDLTRRRYCLRCPPNCGINMAERMEVIRPDMLALHNPSLSMNHKELRTNEINLIECHISNLHKLPLTSARVKSHSVL